ncbi:MAG TPA: hypothetical protein VG602_09180 [Actinomycetota bacterium]|nr:hypothetical protein [Actinomycetota bacterium]
MTQETAPASLKQDGIQSRLRARIAEHTARRAERRALQGWFRNNPPSLGKETGARA